MLIIRIMMLFMLLSAPLLSWAAELQWGEEPYSHFSDQEALPDMLSALAASQKTPIVVSSKVKGFISAHYKEKTAKFILDDVTQANGIIWYFDKESLYLYKEEEVKAGSVSLKNLSPKEFTHALKRLGILDDKFKWEVSSVDNVISFNGPERFVDLVIENARIMDNQKNTTKRVYKWKDNKGLVHYSTEKPVNVLDENWDVKSEEKYPGFVVLDVVKD